ncbi:hypothetical protein ENUP19_0240G0083 [Entamoeba nuttalli]|uniref:C2 domain-containing protein n=1 Tax=Entamoeba nuttalli TaxID=412467 RepID=A0ABQ0DQC5_9EUKA
MEVELKLICGRDLKVCDICTSDPYVKFVINGKKFKSKTKVLTVEPDWDETFKVKLTAGDTIEFQVYDRDLIGRDDFMGKVSWTVPQLFLGQTNFYVLHLDTKGTITFSTKCISGGIPPQIEPHCDVNRPLILRFDVKYVLGLFFGYGLSHGMFVSPLPKTLTGEWETSFGKFRGGITKISSLNYGPERLLGGGRTFYVLARVGEVISFSAFLNSSSAQKGGDQLVKGFYLVPDFHQDEKTEFGFTLEPGGSCFVSCKCVQSIYKNVQPTMIPSEKDYASNVAFPCEVIVKNLEGIGFAGLFNVTPYVTLESNQVEYTTSVLLRERSRHHTYMPKEWNHSFMIPAFVGQKCTVKLMNKKAFDMSTDKDTELVKTEFIWPDFKGQESVDITLPLTKKFGDLKITLKRIRELSAYYRRVYLGEGYPPVICQIPQ